MSSFGVGAVDNFLGIGRVRPLFEQFCGRVWEEEKVVDLGLILTKNAENEQKFSVSTT